MCSRVEREGLANSVQDRLYGDPVSISGSAPDTSCTAALTMLVTTAIIYGRVVPRPVWSGLCSLLCVSATVSSFYRLSRILS